MHDSTSRGKEKQVLLEVTAGLLLFEYQDSMNECRVSARRWVFVFMQCLLEAASCKMQGDT